MMAVCGNTLWLLGGVVEVRSHPRDMSALRSGFCIFGSQHGKTV